jgi:hypothetical protein
VLAPAADGHRGEASPGTAPRTPLRPNACPWDRLGGPEPSADDLGHLDAVELRQAATMARSWHRPAGPLPSAHLRRRYPDVLGHLHLRQRHRMTQIAKRFRCHPADVTAYQAAYACALHAPRSTLPPMREGGRASAVSIPPGGSPPTLRSEPRRQSLDLCVTCQTADAIFEGECFDCALDRLTRAAGARVCRIARTRARGNA